MLFQNRSDAGAQLAEKLKKYTIEKPIILALPRGGVPIGHEIAHVLKAPLKAFVVRKIGAPWNAEFGIGAVAPGVQFLDMDSLHILGIETAEVEDIIRKEQAEVQRRQKLYLQEELPQIMGKIVILVDDGVATGVTTQAAIQALKKLKPAKLILAVPVGPQDILEKLGKLVDEVIYLKAPSTFYSVGAFYHNFPQVSDEEVIQLLKESKKETKQ